MTEAVLTQAVSVERSSVIEAYTTFLSVINQGVGRGVIHRPAEVADEGGAVAGERHWEADAAEPPH